MRGSAIRKLAVLAGVVLCAARLGPAATDEPTPIEKLVAAYRTAPQDYPTGKDARGIAYAQPDAEAWFRWHFYDEAAAERFASARMAVRTLCYNPLEGAGARVPYRSPVKVAFVADHATEGRQCLWVDAPAAEVAAGRATALVGVVPGPSYYPAGSRYRGRHSVAAYWCHWRFLKLDVFNPLAESVGLRVCGVPFVVEPGRSVVAVRTADASGQSGAHSALHEQVAVTVTRPVRDVTLYVDNFRVEQEVPTLLVEKGRMLQFAARADAHGEPVLWPGFTAVGADDLYDAARGFGWTAAAARRRTAAHTFRSFENGLLWGYCSRPDAAFRIDVPNGRHGVLVLATPERGFRWSEGMEAEINGVRHVLLAGKSPQEVRRMALGGEAWDYRPGACVWEELVRQAYYPPTRVVVAEATQGHLSIVVPESVALRAVVVFPEAERDEALAELGRLNFLMAESWDVTHGWVKGDAAERLRYIGFHEESSHPERVPGKLAALKLTEEDFARGFVLFHRGMAEAVYPDTVPSPAEAAVERLTAFASPGEYECLTLGLLPLAQVRDVRVRASGLRGPGGASIPAERIDVRLSRYHQKCMDYGHHNHNYNYGPHDLVRRPSFDLHPAAARRVYVDVHVPADAPAGRYAGEVAVEAAGRGRSARLPVELEVMPIALATPPVLFATEGEHPLLKEYGINAVAGSYDAAASAGFAAVLMCPYDAAPAMARGRRVAWSALAKSREFTEGLIADGLAGKAPRVFFGGRLPGRDQAGPFVQELLRQFPRMEIIGHNTPAYLFAGPGYTWGWDGFQTGVRTRATPELLERASAGGPTFWFVDWVKHAKEQMARFTFGFWCWKLRPMGRYSTFIHNLSYFNGTARLAYPHLPYYALLDIGGCNRYGALSESRAEGAPNPVRDLLLVREGIDDYRYIHTLDTLVQRAEQNKLAGAVVDEAKRFRDGLAAELSLDLRVYYESRGGPEYVSYAENWHPKPGNPWTSSRLDAVRRQCAEHIVALSQAMGR